MPAHSITATLRRDECAHCAVVRPGPPQTSVGAVADIIGVVPAAPAVLQLAMASVLVSDFQQSQFRAEASFPPALRKLPGITVVGTIRCIRTPMLKCRALCAPTADDGADVHWMTFTWICFLSRVFGAHIAVTTPADPHTGVPLVPPSLIWTTALPTPLQLGVAATVSEDVQQK